MNRKKQECKEEDQRRERGGKENRKKRCIVKELSMAIRKCKHLTHVPSTIIYTADTTKYI
jgi:hypothetical protein